MTKETKKMKKLTMNNVTKGMVFKVTSVDEGYLNVVLGLGALKDSRRESVFGITMNPEVGDLVRIVRPPYGSGGKRIDWELVGIEEDDGLAGVWESFWSSFKAQTEYVFGEVKPTIEKELVNTGDSLGKFKGFDVGISSYEVQDYMDFIQKPHISVGIILEFKGDFKGSKKLTTKHINQIKSSEGFAAHVTNIVNKELDENKKEFNKYYGEIKAQTETPELISSSEYTGGKVRLEVVSGNNLGETKQRYLNLINQFVEAKNCRVQIVSEEYTRTVK